MNNHLFICSKYQVSNFSLKQYKYYHTLNHHIAHSYIERRLNDEISKKFSSWNFSSPS